MYVFDERNIPVIQDILFLAFNQVKVSVFSKTFTSVIKKESKKEKQEFVQNKLIRRV